jgi:hypothetical protein
MRLAPSRRIIGRGHVMDQSRNGSGIGRRGALVGVAGLSVSCFAAAAVAQERTKAGTVEIEQVQIAFIGSANVGGGTLNFQGKSYRFTIGGLGVGGFGASRMQATGEVYNLKETKLFPGPYGQARYGVAAGDRSAGQLWMQNPNGVLISLRAKRTGLALSLGADAVYIDFK